MKNNPGCWKDDKQRIPTEENFIKNKSISDLIYGYLKVTSECAFYEDGVVYQRIEKSLVTAPKIIQYYKKQSQERTSPYSENTIRKYIKALVGIGYLEQKRIKGKEYYIIENVISEFAEMPYETLRFLLNVCTANVIKVYAYLKYKYSTYCYYKCSNKFRFSQKFLCEMLGYNSSNEEPIQQIKDILNILMALELIEIHQEYIKTKMGNMTQYYVLDKVNDDYKECDISQIKLIRKKAKKKKESAKIKIPAMVEKYTTIQLRDNSNEEKYPSKKNYVRYQVNQQKELSPL